VRGSSESISEQCESAKVRSRHVITKEVSRPNGALNSVWIHANIDLLGIRSDMFRLRFGIHE
jgi:hypothetical protein